MTGEVVGSEHLKYAYEDDLESRLPSNLWLLKERTPWYGSTFLYYILYSAGWIFILWEATERIPKGTFRASIIHEDPVGGLGRHLGGTKPSNCWKNIIIARHG